MPKTPGNSSNPVPNNSYAHRVIAFLNREQVDFLDQIGKDALFSSGSKLSRTQIISAMINVLRRLNLTGQGVTTPQQFEQRIVEEITKKQRPDKREDLRS